MPSKTFPHFGKDLQTLEITWDGNWNNPTISCDGETVGSFANQKELRAGENIALADGSTLWVQLIKTFSYIELILLHNGEHIVFYSVRDGHPEIYVLDINKNVQHRVTTGFMY